VKRVKFLPGRRGLDVALALLLIPQDAWLSRYALRSRTWLSRYASDQNCRWQFAPRTLKSLSKSGVLARKVRCVKEICIKDLLYTKESNLLGECLGKKNFPHDIVGKFTVASHLFSVGLFGLFSAASVADSGVAKTASVI
jgi:hypothetical protein